jgi:hypothetical protein
MKTVRKIPNATYWMLLTFALSACSEPEHPKPSLTNLSLNEGHIGTQVIATGENLLWASQYTSTFVKT